MLTASSPTLGEALCQAGAVRHFQYKPWHPLWKIYGPYVKSGDVLPCHVPEHEIEEGLPEITAYLRTEPGKSHCFKLRQDFRTPCHVWSVGGKNLNDHINVHLRKRDADNLVRIYGRHGIKCRVFKMNILDSKDQLLKSLRVLPEQVYINSQHQWLESIKFLFCPQDRVVKIRSPVKIVNDDICPGVRKGGWLHLTMRTIPLQAFGASVPPYVEVDVSKLELDKNIKLRYMQFPPGTVLRCKDDRQAVVRCATSIGGD